MSKYTVASISGLLMCLAWALAVGWFDANVYQVPLWLNIPVSFIAGFFLIWPAAARFAGLDD